MLHPLTSMTIFRKHGVKAILVGQVCYILKTHSELAYPSGLCMTNKVRETNVLYLVVSSASKVDYINLSLVII